MDLYHVQIVEGDVAMKIREFIGKVDHFQIAGVPERHEPDIGEMNYPYIFDLIDELGFVPLSKTGAELLFKVFSQRYERGATLVTSN